MKKEEEEDNEQFMRRSLTTFDEKKQREKYLSKIDIKGTSVGKTVECDRRNPANFPPFQIHFVALHRRDIG